MSTLIERVQAIVEPLLVSHALELFDLDHQGGRIVITVDRPGGADVGSITAATRTISRALDAHDTVPGAYTLEVTSPGLERPLRTPTHFTWAVGREVAVKLLPTAEGDRRLAGVLESFDPTSGMLVVRSEDGSSRAIDQVDIEKARTVFSWGAAPKPTSPSKANQRPGGPRTPKSPAGSSKRPPAAAEPDAERDQTDSDESEKRANA